MHQKKFFQDVNFLVLYIFLILCGLVSFAVWFCLKFIKKNLYLQIFYLKNAIFYFFQTLVEKSMKQPLNEDAILAQTSLKPLLPLCKKKIFRIYFFIPFCLFITLKIAATKFVYFFEAVDLMQMFWKVQHAFDYVTLLQEQYGTRKKSF